MNFYLGHLSITLLKSLFQNSNQKHSNKVSVGNSRGVESNKSDNVSEIGMNSLWDEFYCRNVDKIKIFQWKFMACMVILLTVSIIGKCAKKGKIMGK